MRTNRLLFYMAVLLFSLGTMAQGEVEQMSVFSGRVVDAQTRRPMARVSVTDRRVGTVTNEQGEFTLKVKDMPKFLTFSYVGYQTQRVPTTQSDLGTIRMRPSTVMLNEVVVTKLDAEALVYRAIDRIADNYPKVPNLLRSFYRETTQKRRQFISIAEGVIDIYKTPYGRVSYRDAVAIDKGRRLLSMKASDTLAVKLEGGPVMPVQLDVVKNPEVLFDREELANYSFSYMTPEWLGDRPQYVIEMKPRLAMHYALYNGTFYIDQETLAFTRIELSLDMRDPEKVTRAILRKKPAGLRFTPHELSISVDYKTDSLGVTRLNYMRNVIRFRCDWKRRVFKSNFTVTSEMVVTDWREGADAKPIKGRSSFYSRDKFYDKVVFFDDPDFWGADNIIEPTESLLKGVKKLRQKIREE